MPVSGRYGNPAPSSPPVPVPEREPQVRLVGRVGEVPVFEPIEYSGAKPTATTLRASMQARAEELRTQIAGMQAAKDELALIERMLEVK